MMGARLLGTWLPGPADPFSAYADVFPGQPRRAVAERGFSCPASEFNPGAGTLAVQTCVLWPAKGPFAQIVVSVTPDGIGQLQFVLYGGALRVGDLTVWWGPPTLDATNGVRVYRWHVDGTPVAAVVRLGRRVRMAPLEPIFKLAFVEDGAQRLQR